jgi:ATP-dependent Clp protease ATP-binding subunit ClpA
VGQDAAVAAALGAARLGRLGLHRGRRPLASLLLTGPSGVSTLVRTSLCQRFCVNAANQA